MSVELGIADRPGGTLYAWWVDDIGIYRCFDGLGDWIAEIAALLNADIYRSMRRPGDPPSLFVPTELEWSPDPSSPGRNHLPRGVKMTKSSEGLEAWPAHWQQVNGSDPGSVDSLPAMTRLSLEGSAPCPLRIRRSSAAT